VLFLYVVELDIFVLSFRRHTAPILQAQ